MNIPPDQMAQWVASFKARFPEFTVSDNQIAYALDYASRFVNCSWVPGDCGLAILFLAAHYLALQLMAADALPVTNGGEDGGGGVIGGGQVTSVQFETMKVSFSAPKFAASGGSSGGTDSGAYGYESTPYGQFYLNLLIPNEPAVLLV